MTSIVFTRAMARALHNTAVMLEERGDARICNTCIPDYMGMTTEPRVADVAQQALLAWVNVGREAKFKNVRAWCMAKETTTIEVVNAIRWLASTMDENIAAATILERAALMHRVHGTPHLLLQYLIISNDGVNVPLRPLRIFYNWLNVQLCDHQTSQAAALKCDADVQADMNAWAHTPWRTAHEVIYALEACAQEITRI